MTARLLPLVLLLAGGCAMVPRAPPPPAPAAAPPSAPAARPEPVARADFALTGTFTQGGLVTGTAPAGIVRLTLDGRPVGLAADGGFVIAFDRDAGTEALLEAELADGRRLSRPLSIGPRAWRIERLDSLPRIAQPSAEFERLRPPELAMIAAARAVDRDSDGWRQRFIWPVTGRISGLFGSQRIYRGEPGSYHSGVDIARPAGTPVVAPADGVVSLASDRPFTLEGNLLILDHGMGLNSAFLHLSRIDVKPGDRIRQGQVVGTVGATGRATGAHLHWGMKWRDARIDPLLIAGPMPAPALTTRP